MNDPWNLARFVAAQDTDGTFRRAVGELRSGAKRTHWIWFVFTQLAAIGRSQTARHYGLSGRAEAEAHAAHPVLRPRLDAAVEAALDSGTADPHALLGSPDDLKFRSCLTLFAAVDPASPLFPRALETFYGGARCDRTEALLAAEARGALPPDAGPLGSR